MMSRHDFLIDEEARRYCYGFDSVAALADYLFASGGAAAAAGEGAAAVGEGAVDAGALASGAAAAGEGAAAVGGGAAAAGELAGTGLAATSAIPEVLVTGALPEATGELAGADLAGLGGAVAAGTQALAGAGASPTPASGASTLSPGGGGNLGGTGPGGLSTPSGAAPGASGGSIGGPATPSLSNAAPGADIANAGEVNVTSTPLSQGGGGAFDSTGLDGLAAGTGLSGINSLGTPSTTTPKKPGLTDRAAGYILGEDSGNLGTGGDILSGTLKALPGALPLAYTAIKGDQAPKGTNALTSEAEQLQAQGKGMSSYLTNGTLPPGIQSALTSAQNSAIASIKSNYASRGQTGSSAEAQDIANTQAQMAGQGANVAMQLYSQGVSEEQVAAQIQEGLLSNTIQSDASFTSALGTFASALAGSAGGSNIKVSVG